MSSARTAAVAAWTGSGVLLAFGWAMILFAPDRWLLGGMCAATACVFAVIAAVMQVRIYVVKVCALIRRTSGLSSVETGSNVHAFQ